MKNIILKSITNVMAIIFMIAVSMLDSDSIIPGIASIISIVWIVLFVIVNHKTLFKDYEV